MLFQKSGPYSIKIVLPLLISLLVVCAVVPLIAVTYRINSSITNSLLSARAELIVDGLENQLTGLLEPVNLQMSSARDYIENESLKIDDPVRFEAYMEGILTGTEQVTGIGVIRPDGTMRRWERGKQDAIEEASEMLPLVGQALVEASFSQDVRWSAPFVSLVLGDIVLNPRVTLRRDGEVFGILTAGVTGKKLSQYVTQLSEQNVTAFILYDKDKLIAHPDFASVGEQPNTTSLPKIQDSNLDIIRDIWNEPNGLTQVSRLDRTDGHWSYIDGVPYAYFYRELDGYAPESLLVGVAILASESFWFRWAALMAAALGAILLLISVFIAFALARQIAAPVIQIEDALGKLQNMEFDRVSLPKLNSSNIAEWRSSASNLTSTASALSMFNQYVPSKLAKRLMSSPSETARAQERAVTVMFIDMEGFSEFARTHTANQSAERLNDVFKIIGPIIEASGGVIDKYTGDGLMAFWGAPDDQPDHTHRAITSAYEIRQAIIGVSSEVWFQGTPRLRLGMHCGSAIVGNLGFKGRINYTLVGNTVNSAERVEQALRGQDIERHVVIGLSGEMFDRSKPFKGSDQATKLVIKGIEIVILND